MLFVHVVNNAATKMTGREVEAYLKSIGTMPPGDLTLASLSEFGIFPLVAVERPTPGIDEVVSEGTPSQINGQWTQVWITSTKPVRASLRPGEWRRALESRNRWAAFKTYFANLSPSDQLDWVFIDRIDRGGPEIAALQAASGLTNAQLNAIFRV